MMRVRMLARIMTGRRRVRHDRSYL